MAAFIRTAPCETLQRFQRCRVARAALINDLSSTEYALSRVYVYAGLPPGARGQGMRQYNYVLLPWESFMQLTGSPFRKRPWPVRVFSYFALTLSTFAFIDHGNCVGSSYLSLYTTYIVRVSSLDDCVERRKRKQSGGSSSMALSDRLARCWV